jgi:hypothetical protein
MEASVKTTQEQVRELHKLVADAGEKLDQVRRGLRFLEERLAEEASGGAGDGRGTHTGG